MKEGFFFYRSNIYYGLYNEEQVSGGGTISRTKPEYEDMQTMLMKMNTFMNLNTEQKVDFSFAEERINISFPKELKLVYTAIHDQEEYFSNTEHFLPLDEIYMEQGIIVFSRKSGHQLPDMM